MIILDFKKTLVALLVSCMPIFVTAQTAAVSIRAQASVGGSDVGGGGSLLLPLAERKDLDRSIYSAKKSLIMWFNKKQIEFDQHQVSNLALYAKVFNGPRSIYDVLKDLAIEYRMSDSCYDKFGRKFDGSIYTKIGSTYPDAICISGQRLLKKLRKDDFDSQTKALILHEASHLIGTTEQEAVALQTDALLETMPLENSTLEMWMKVDFFESEIEQLEKSLIGLSFTPAHDSQLNTQIDLFLSKNFETIVAFYNGGFTYSPFDAQNTDRALSIAMRIWNLRMATCDTVEGGIDCQIAYDAIFESQSAMPASEFNERTQHLSWPSTGKRADEIVRKVTTKEDLMRALSDLQLDAETLYKSAFALGLGAGNPFTIYLRN